MVSFLAVALAGVGCSAVGSRSEESTPDARPTTTAQPRPEDPATSTPTTEPDLYYDPTEEPLRFRCHQKAGESGTASPDTNGECLLVADTEYWLINGHYARAVAWTVDPNDPRRLLIDACTDPSDVIAWVADDSPDAPPSLIIGIDSRHHPCPVDGSVAIPNPTGSPDVLSGVTRPPSSTDLETVHQVFAAADWSNVVLTPDKIDLSQVACRYYQDTADDAFSIDGLPSGAAVDLIVGGEVLASTTIPAQWWLALPEGERRPPQSSTVDNFVEEPESRWTFRLYQQGGSEILSALQHDPGGPFLRILIPGYEPPEFRCGPLSEIRSVPPPNCRVELIGGSPLITFEALADDYVLIRNQVVINLAPEALYRGVYSPFLDTEAPPDQPVQYQVQAMSLSNDDLAPALVSCGPPIVPNGTRSLYDELQLAQHLAQDSDGRDFPTLATGPRLLVSVERICDCPLAGTPLEFSFGHETGLDLSEPGALQEDFATEVDPFTIHQRLLDALGADREVTVQIDGQSGAITEFTIDGVGWRYLCFHNEFSPVEFGGATRCHPERSIID